MTALTTSSISRRTFVAAASSAAVLGAPAYAQSGNITLKWGVTDSLELANWHQLVVDGATPLDAAPSGPSGAA